MCIMCIYMCWCVHAEPMLLKHEASLCLQIHILKTKHQKQRAADITLSSTGWWSWRWPWTLTESSSRESGCWDDRSVLTKTSFYHFHNSFKSGGEQEQEQEQEHEEDQEEESHFRFILKLHLKQEAEFPLYRMFVLRVNALCTLRLRQHQEVWTQ